MNTSNHTPAPFNWTDPTEFDRHCDEAIAVSRPQPYDEPALPEDGQHVRWGFGAYLLSAAAMAGLFYLLLLWITS